jgi:hypothetical protein
MVPTQKTRLRDLHALVVELKQAADQRNGEQIGALVERYHALAAELVQQPLTAENPAEKAELTRFANEIMALQVEIEQLAAPWMDDLRILLRESRQEKAVNATYRTEP